MLQDQDFQPIEGLTQCQTCLDCPMFINFEGDRSRGWCSAFEPHKDQFKGFYISSFNHSYPDAEF